MDKVRFYSILDIESPDEFKFYENLASLLEESGFIEENLIKDLFRDVDKEKLAEHFDSYFEAFLGHLPDSETNMYITVDNIRRAFSGMIYDGMTDDEISSLASETAKFRKWYVHDLNAYDRINGRETSVMEARYDIAAAKLLGEDADFDFRPALDYSPEGYDMRIADILEAAAEDGL